MLAEGINSNSGIVVSRHRIHRNLAARVSGRTMLSCADGNIARIAVVIRKIVVIEG